MCKRGGKAVLSTSIAFIYIFGPILAFAFTSMQPIYPEAVTASCASLLNNFTPVGLNNVSAPAQVCQLLPKPEADWLLVLRLFRLLGPVRIYLHLLVLCK